MARCALPLGTSVTITDGNGGVFPDAKGVLGLAPAWTTRGLAAVERRWLMSCLMTHVNAVGATVRLSIRANHPALAIFDPGELSAAKVEEGSFWGDFGVSSANGEFTPQQFYTCYGKRVFELCGAAQAAAYMKKRLCTLGDPRCGNLIVVGPCGDYVGSGKAACAGRTIERGYTACYTKLSTATGIWPVTATKRVEVITSYLESDPTSCL